jgi:hypothetical protein
MLEWTAQYYTLKTIKKKSLHDFSTVRFTLNEIQLFLFLNGLKSSRLLTENLCL